MEKVLLSPQEILELIRKQPRMTSERFWMEVEKAQEFSPNEEPCSNGRSDYRDEYRIIDQLQECEAGVEARRAMSFEPRVSRMVTDEQAMLARPVPGLAVPLPAHSQSSLQMVLQNHCSICFANEQHRFFR